jgi:hypothetical protein
VILQERQSLTTRLLTAHDGFQSIPARPQFCADASSFGDAERRRVAGRVTYETASAVNVTGAATSAPSPAR